MKGLVFDIRRFSTHDGAGVRTNVFLKGCPLRCAWCQNPEGLEMRRRPAWFSGRCMGCGTCAALATRGGARLVDGRVVLAPEAPEDWELLVDECPCGALRFDARWMDVEEVVREAEKDRVFYRQGGGVTLSGGEPLMQGDFACALLEALRERGIHTAIETSLSVGEGVVRRALPLVDQIFCDVKLADSARHRELTGAGNERVLANVRWLLASDLRERACVRTPLIPGHTATDENVAAIAALLAGLYPEVRYELLNYNPLAEAKYRDLDRDYCFDEHENPPLYTQEHMRHFVDVARGAGCKNAFFES